MKKNKLLLLMPFILSSVVITGCDINDLLNNNTSDKEDSTIDDPDKTISDSDESSEDPDINDDPSDDPINTSDEIIVKKTFSDTNTQNYYSSINISKDNSELRKNLCSKINYHTALSYKPGVWNAYKTTDTNAEGKVYCIYTGLTFNYGTTDGGQQDQGTGGTAEGQFYNREHTSPKSWFGSTGPEYTDLYNVYPTDKYINGKRGNMDYGEVGNATITSSNGSKIGVSKRSDNAATVFEIADEYKGDIARSYFYMATCYMNSTAWNGNCDSKVYSVSSTGIDLSQHGIDLLLKWAHNDPVSEKEIARNNAVYALQGNRNPFIDYENLETYIWTPSANYLDM
ncbi:MAG: endonuclease [Bacilli bacterium]